MPHRLLPTNEHPLDRGLRVVLGLALLSFTLGGSGFVWGYIGILPLLTGILGSCPLYTALGISTIPYQPAEKIYR
jgi:hypothetical protein